MTCTPVKLPGGGSAIICGPKQRYPKCRFCPTLHDGTGANPATLLCDFPVAKTLGGDVITCDAQVCERCARRVGDKDFCPKHPEVTP